uniref:Protection of telomeres protein 1b-like n=1 Tax=Rhizophora mucronata TaxID=61149 RepID=A0A2P2M0D8_RHIMU
MEAHRDDYKFLEIRDAVACINQKVSLLAVVLEFGLPKKSKGTDWYCTMKIIDESHPQPGLSVNFFAESPELLPRIASVGDIIQLSSVMMRCHHGEVNAVFDKRFSSFALYEGKDGKDLCPYRSSSRFHARDLDSNFVAELRKWLSHFQLNEGSSSFLYLRDIKEEQLDLVCKILHVYEVAKNEWMALVWDGTDSAPVIIRQRSVALSLDF